MGKVNKNQGFTLLEVTIVIGIITVMLAVSTGIYFSLRQRNVLDVEAQKIASALRLAHNRTLASEGLDSHGVHFDMVDNNFILFRGETFDPIDPDNEQNELGDTTEFLNIQLEGAGVDVVYDRLAGTTGSSGFLEIAYVGDSSDKRTICIEGAGSVYVLKTGEDSAICVIGDLEYTEGITDSDLANFPGNLGDGDPAQSFTLDNDNLSVSRVDLLIRKSGTPSDVFLEIRDTNTVGDVLGKSLVIKESAIPASLSWIQFIFADPVQLSANTQYFMRLRSLPDSTIGSSGAAGTIIWGYEHSASAPPAYAGGDAWLYVGANNNPSDIGQRMGPADQYDFSFRIHSRQGPQNRDSRHMEFDLEFSLREPTITNITLSFNGGAVVENLTIADFMNGSQTKFNWEGEIDVGGSIQFVRIHSLYIDDKDTTLSVHRDAELNDASLDIDIDAINLVDYTAGGVPTKGSTIGSMIYK